MGFKHLHLSFDQIHDMRVARLSLDYDGRSANILSTAMIDELSSACAQLESETGLGLVILQSAKPSGFVFGADITEFETLTTEDEVRHLQEQAMKMLDRLAHLPIISVAFLHGPALGGGLELALACDYRLVSSEGRLMLGFPEVNLGLMPGFAGTARASRLLGAETSLSLCETGKPIIKADKAVALGLADEAIAKNKLDEKAYQWAKKGKRQFEAHKPMDVQSLPLRLATIKEQSPPNSIPHIEALYTHFEMAAGDYESLITGELRHFPKMMAHPVSNALRHVFAITDKVKKQAKGASKIAHIYVIGAGAMGGDIATLLAFRGKHVTLFDVNQEALLAARAKADAYFDRKLSPEDSEAAKTRLVLGDHATDLSQFDLIIEAVPEKMALKQAIWADIEPKVRDDCILATNTSALDLDEIATALSQPERLVGLHFFNPATVMPLVEIIHRATYKTEMFDELMKLTIMIGKMPILVRNSPGFIVNRALLPYIYEALHQMIKGEQPDEIDQAFIAYGMPMGPIELADQIGLDVCLDAGQPIGMADEVRALLQDKIAKGELGRKSKRGFYEWEDKKAIRPRASIDAAKSHQLQMAILAPLVKACQEAVANGDVIDSDFVDAALIFGMGFPRHRGGPLWAQNGGSL